MENFSNKEKNLRELAGRIYDLDEEVYRELGSALGRVFNGKKEDCIEETVRMMHERNQAYILRSELALISNIRLLYTSPSPRDISGSTKPTTA